MSSSARLVPREHSSSTSSSGSLPAPPTPPLVLAAKTSPVQARLSNSQAATQTRVSLGELHRVSSPVEAKKPKVLSSRSGGGVVAEGEGDGGMESAASLLQSVKEDDQFYAQQKKKNGGGLSLGRSSPSFRQKISDRNSSINKRYVKMGILLSDSPSEVSTYRSHHGRGAGISSPSRSHTPPFPAVGKVAGTTSLPVSRGTSPVYQQHSTTISSPSSSSAINQLNQEYLLSASPSGSASPLQSTEGVAVRIRPYMEKDSNGSRLPDDEMKDEVYEVIDLKDVGSLVVDQTDRTVSSVQNAQPSPPISMKSESLNSEEPMSSPDSGYGNTPEYPNANASTENKAVEEAQQNGVQELHERDGCNDTDHRVGLGTNDASTDRSGGVGKFSTGQRSSNLALAQQQTVKEGVQLTRPSIGSSSSAVISDREMRELRSRGDTDESLFSGESIVSSPDGVGVSERGAGGGENPQVFERPQAKIYLGRQHSVPSAIGSGAKSSTTLRNQPSTSQHQTGQFPFHMSPSTGSLSTYGTSHSSNRYSQPVITSPYAFSELHPSHPSHPSQPQAVGGISASQSMQTIQRRVRHSPEPRKKKFRSTSLAFSRSTEIKSSRSVKSSTLNQVQNEKDYFQVTDELAKENSHFALSEALLAVVEQYKANQFEQELELSSPLPPMSPLSPLPSQSASTPGSMTDSPNYPSPQWDNSSSVSTVTTTTWTPPSSVGGSTVPWTPTSGAGGMASWGSFASISTADGDPMESSIFRRPQRISLLDMISSPVWDNSAESTAQRLLQHMATRLIGNESTETLNMSQLKLKLPTEFLSSLLLDEDLQKSVTTSSAHMRGSREWAPPRTQIIYHIKMPSKNIQKDLAAQDYRCTGCGMKVDPSQARYFRFCTYTGRYFCHNCHTNATSIIPAYVMSKWSFKRLPVSNYARDLLSKFYSEPVFTAVPREIYEKVPLMAQARDLRRQLVSIKHYLKTCRDAANLNLNFEGYAPWTIDLTSYSLEDFVEIKGGVKMRHLRSMLFDAVSHVKNCPLCRGKGFVCEFCQKSDDIIFPFELHKIRKCRVCDCCFHKECFGSRQASCPRCLRLQKRLKQRQEETKSPTNRDTKTRTTKDYSSEVK